MYILCFTDANAEFGLAFASTSHKRLMNNKIVQREMQRWAHWRLHDGTGWCDGSDGADRFIIDPYSIPANIIAAGDQTRARGIAWRM